MRLFISAGKIRAIYNDVLLPVARNGRSSVKRASHVEPLGDTWAADLSPVGGPILGGFATRDAALEAEAKWLNRNQCKMSESLTEVCPACEGQRWLIFTTDREPFLEVLRCDQCSDPELTDNDAARIAIAAGLQCDLVTGAVSEAECKRWMALYPNRGIIPRK